MKFNDFIKDMVKTFHAVDVWHESGGLDEGMFVYFKDNDGQIRFVFMALVGPIYVNSLLKGINIKYIKDIGINNTIGYDGVIPVVYDLIIILKEGIEDLEMDEESCDNCDCECNNNEKESDKNRWN